VGVYLLSTHISPGARRARRPPYSALTSERLGKLDIAPMRPWREALAHYLEAKGLVR
jgi:dTDP-4-dehydrorhamnose reductase